VLSLFSRRAIVRGCSGRGVLTSLVGLDEHGEEANLNLFLDLSIARPPWLPPPVLYGTPITIRFTIIDVASAVSKK
jgi:hypothetical protein